MKETKKYTLTEYANTPMTPEMFKWVTDRAWELRMSRSAFIRALIEAAYQQKGN